MGHDTLPAGMCQIHQLELADGNTVMIPNNTHGGGALFLPVLDFLFTRRLVMLGGWLLLQFRCLTDRQLERPVVRLYLDTPFYHETCPRQQQHLSLTGETGERGNVHPNGVDCEHSTWTTTHEGTGR